jgi:hypothetical protein
MFPVAAIFLLTHDTTLPTFLNALIDSLLLAINYSWSSWDITFCDMIGKAINPGISV